MRGKWLLAGGQPCRTEPADLRERLPSGVVNAPGQTPQPADGGEAPVLGEDGHDRPGSQCLLVPD